MDLPPLRFGTPASPAASEPPPPPPPPAAPEKPKPRRWKRWLLGLGVAALVLVLLVLFLTPTLVNALVRPVVVSTLQASLNGEPAIERLSFSWFSGVEVAGIRIGNPPGFSEAPCVTVERVTVDASLPSLLSGKVVLKGPLRVGKTRVNVEQNEKGEINLAMLAKPGPAAAGGAPEEKPAGASAALPHVEAALLVEEFVLSVKTPDLVQPATLAPIRVESRVDTLDNPVTFTVSSADGSLDVKGSLQVATGGRLDIPGLKGGIAYALKPALLAPLKPALASIGPLTSFDGDVEGAGRIDFDGLAKPSGKADLKIELREVALALAAAAGAPAGAPAAKVLTLKPGTIRAACEFKLGADNVTDIDAKVTSPAASLAFKGQVSANPGRMAVSGDPSVSVDLAEAAKRFPGIVASDRKLQGRITGSVKGLKATSVFADPAAPQAAVEAEVDLRGEGIAEVTDAGVQPILKDAAVALRVAVDTAKGTYRLEGVDAHLDELLTAKGHLRVAGLVLPAAGKDVDVEKLATDAALDADLAAAADLGGLLAKARQFTDLIPKALAVSGTVDGRLRVTPAKGGTKVSPFTLAAGAKGLQVAGLEALEGIELPKDLAASAEGEVDLAGDWGATLATASFESTLATASANGKARNLRTKPEGEMTLSVKAQTDAVAAAVAKRLGDTAFSGSPVSVSARVSGGADGGRFEVFVTAPALDLRGLPGPAPRVEVREASLKLAGAGSAGWQKVEVSDAQAAAVLAPGADPAAKAAGATSEKPPVPSPVKLSARATADLAAGTYEAAGVEASLPGATLTAAAALAMPPAPMEKGPAPSPLAAATVKATADLAGEIKPLLALARTWKLPVEDLDGTGSVAVRLEAEGPLGKLAVRRFRADERTVALSGKTIPAEVRWPLTFAQEVSLVVNVLDPAAPVEMVSGSFVAPGIAVTTLQGTVDAQGKGNDLAVAGTLDPAALVAAVPGYLKETALASGPGSFSLTLRGALLAPQVALKADLPETRLMGKALPKEGVALGKPSAELQAALDLEKRVYELTQATIKTALVSADARASLAMDEKGGFAKLEGSAQGTAALATLREVAVAFGALPPESELTGDVSFVAGAKASGPGVFPFTAEVKTPALHVKMPVAREGKPPAVVALDEPEGAFTLVGTFANTGTGFEVTIADPSALKFQVAQGTLRGKIRSVPPAAPEKAAGSTPKPAPLSLLAEGLTAEVTYDPAKLKPILAAFEAGAFTVNERQALKVALNGPLLPGDDLRAWLAGFTCDASLGFGGFANTTVKVEGKPVPVALKDGRLPVDYACMLNGGAVAAQGLVDTQGEGTRLTMTAREVGVNANMAGALQYLNPILHVGKDGSLEGQASLEMESAWHGLLPFSMPYAGEPAGPEKEAKIKAWTESLVTKHATARGRFSAKNLKISGSPLLTDIVNTLMGGQSGEVGEIQPTDFTLGNGVFTYKNMVTRIGKMDLVFSGWIRVDQKMEMQVVAPVPKTLRAGNPSLDKYIGPTVVIPLKGKVSSPQFNYKEAVTLLLKEAAEAALKDKGMEKATDALTGLFDRKKK